MSLASANVSDDLFMQVNDSEMFKLKAGVCQALDQGLLYDLKKFDLFGREGE